MTWHDRRLRWFVGAWLCAAVIWWIVSTWVAPALIRAGYEERSLELVNRVFEGRTEHDVAHYLSLWGSLVRTGWLALLLAALAAPVLWWAGPFLAPAWRRLADPGGLDFAGALGLGAWLGLGLGFLEYLVNRVWLSHLGAWSWWANPHQSWMLPLVNALILAGLGALLFLLLGGARRRLSAMALFIPLTAVGAFGIIRSLRKTGVHEAAALILALGIAVSLARVLSSRRGGFARLVRRTAVPGVLLFALLGASLQVWRWAGERRALGTMPAAPEGAPDVLLIVLDTVRSASLGLYGYLRPTTPNLSRLAAEGAVFDSAFATSSWTLPSHASLFTGRSHHEMSADFTVPLDDSDPTLAEALTRAGYATGGFVANFHFTSRWTGLARGFLHYEDFPVSLPVAFHSGWLSHELGRRVMGVVDPEQDPMSRKFSEDVNEEFLDWVSGIDGRPYFAFLNYFDAHNPYIMFEEHASGFPAEAPPMPPGVTESHIRDYRDRYDTSIAYMDQRIADLLDELEARGRLENTVVVVVSDHGEHFGENGVYGHGRALYAPGVHVPLLVWAPGMVPPRRVGTPVSIRDIPATIMDLTGLSADAPFPGETLARHWAGGSDSGDEAGSTGGAELVLTENNPNPLNLDPAFPVSAGPLKSLLSSRFQYIRHADGREELYDTSEDRWQEHDLSDTPIGRRELPRFRAELGARGLAGPPSATALRQR